MVSISDFENRLFFSSTVSNQTKLLLAVLVLLGPHSGISQNYQNYMLPQSTQQNCFNLTSFTGNQYQTGMQQQTSRQFDSPQNVSHFQNASSPQKIKAAKLNEQIKELESQIAKLERNQSQIAALIEKILDPEIADFLLHLHIDKLNRCDDYKTHPKNNCYDEALVSNKKQQAFCGGKDDVPEKLRSKWIADAESGEQGYCIANADKNRGTISSTICSDEKLKSEDSLRHRTSFMNSTSSGSCSSALSKYRVNKIKIDNYAEKLDGLKEQLDELNSSEVAENNSDGPGPGGRRTEGTAEAGMMSSGRESAVGNSWLSSLTQVLGTFASLWLNQRQERVAQVAAAQSGQQLYTGQQLYQPNQPTLAMNSGCQNSGYNALFSNGSSNYGYNSMLGYNGRYGLGSSSSSYGSTWPGNATNGYNSNYGNGINTGVGSGITSGTTGR